MQGLRTANSNQFLQTLIIEFHFSLIADRFTKDAHTIMTLTAIIREFATSNGFDVTTSTNGKEFTMALTWSFCDYGTIAIVKMNEDINDGIAEVISECGSVKVQGSAELINALNEAWAN